MDLKEIEKNILSEIKQFANKSNDFYVLHPNNGVPEQLTKIVIDLLKDEN